MRHEIGGGKHEQERIKAVENTAMARQDRTHVFDAEVPLDSGFTEVTDRGDQRADQREGERCHEVFTDRFDVEYSDDGGLDLQR